MDTQSSSHRTDKIFSISSLNRILLILGLLLIVTAAVAFLDDSSVGKDYISWVKSFLVSINPLKAGVSLNVPSFQESELTLPEIGQIVEQEDLFPESEVVKEIVGQEVGQLTLVQIEEQLGEIGNQIDEIDIRVKQLLILTDIQNEINKIAIEAKLLSTQLIVLAQANNIGQNVDVLAERI